MFRIVLKKSIFDCDSGVLTDDDKFKATVIEQLKIYNGYEKMSAQFA
jgi:hypothetical protein